MPETGKTYQVDTIYHEDCLQGMQRIPDGAVDCVICDLPYGVLNPKNKETAWDRPLPLNELWTQWLRVARKNAPVILFGKGMYTAELMLSQKKLWRYNLVWKKGNRVTAFLNAGRMPLPNHEDICVFYRKLPTYHPQMTLGEKNHARGNVTATKRRLYADYRDVPTGENSEWKWPRSIIDIDNDYDKRLHPTQKPVNLLRYLIRTYTDDGALILDSTAGSGTTAVAALREKRHFVAFETDPEFYRIASERIETEKTQQLTLF